MLIRPNKQFLQIPTSLSIYIIRYIEKSASYIYYGASSPLIVPQLHSCFYLLTNYQRCIRILLSWEFIEPTLNVGITPINSPLQPLFCKDIKKLLMFLQLFSQNIWFVLIVSLPLHPLSRIKYSDALKKEFFERFTYNREVVQEAGMLFILIQ